ncbi:peptidoglycan recognition protein family protein [Occultella gossypii]|uniref:N-acetylmuramoyl-L-alanine amidase n=1 Tax=Occultella gossypii TaxID=2800820 RepID=A0ABS7SAS3_9MICO|nr:N-acetylmuramoyl-L-alanine amidase [Occultella gossypii]MBZ2197285.1 N-acetylmuramoyl-L-alanine amidase [Occultella gossypii]
MSKPVPNGGRYPGADWDPIKGRSTRVNRPVRMTVHITAVRANDIYGPGKGPSGTYAHLHNSRDGDFRQHQELHHRTYADLDGNGKTVSVENEGREGDSLTADQVDNLARLFAYLVTEYDVPNRIATWKDTRGLAWHRLGVSGNFGRFSTKDRRTWSAAQTGERWTEDRGKTCPTNRVIDQIDDIFNLAQRYITGKGATPAPTPEPAPRKAPTMYVTKYGRNAWRLITGDYIIAIPEADYNAFVKAGVPHETLTNELIKTLEAHLKFGA